MKEYLDAKIRTDIIKEISNLDLPEQWNSKQTVDYIIRKIDKK